MKLKYALFLGFSLLILNANFAQTSSSEIVISEEKVQQLANKLYALKIERNTLEKSNAAFYVENHNIKSLNNLLETDSLSVDTLLYVIEQLMLSEKYNENATLAYNFNQRYDEDKSTKNRAEYINQSSEEVKSGKIKSKSESKSKSTQIENNTDSQEILKRLNSIENQLKELKLQKNENVILERGADKNREDVVIKNRQDKNTPVILAMQKKQSQDLDETNAKLDSVLKVVSSPKRDSLMSPKATAPENTVESQNNQSIESLKNQIYLLHAKLDRVLDEQIEAEAIKKVETASTLSDTVYIDKTKEVDSAQEAYEARKLKYGNYFRQIFFANNSTKVDEEYQELISNLVTRLNNEPKIDVSIAGYASKTGNESYNQQISMQRALALKKILIQEGISPKRILTDFKGIDYDASNLSEARRLDIEFEVRK